MSKFKVAEASCYVTVPGAGAILLYRDAPVPDSAENLDQLEADGFIVAVEDEEVGGHPSDLPDDYAPPAFAEAPDENGEVQEVDDVDGDGPIPPKSATKAEWVDYAVSQGAVREDAEASTKEDLIAAYGAA